MFQTALIASSIAVASYARSLNGVNSQESCFNYVDPYHKLYQDDWVVDMNTQKDQVLSWPIDYGRDYMTTSNCGDRYFDVDCEGLPYDNYKTDDKGKFYLRTTLAPEEIPDKSDCTIRAYFKDFEPNYENTFDWAVAIFTLDFQQ